MRETIRNMLFVAFVLAFVWAGNSCVEHLFSESPADLRSTEGSQSWSTLNTKLQEDNRVPDDAFFEIRFGEETFFELQQQRLHPKEYVYHDNEALRMLQRLSSSESLTADGLCGRRPSFEGARLFWTSEPAWLGFRIEESRQTGQLTSLDLPRPWVLDDRMDVGLGLVSVVGSYSLTVYSLGRTITQIELPHSGDWRILRSFEESSVDGNTLHLEGGESVEEIRELIGHHYALLVDDLTSTAWAVIDGKATLLAEDVVDCALELGTPDEPSGDRATAFYWKDSSSKVYLSEWKKLGPRVLVEGEIINGHFLAA